jgi:hypothetical protein
MNCRSKKREMVWASATIFGLIFGCIFQKAEAIMCDQVRELGPYNFIQWKSSSTFADRTANWISSKTSGSTTLFFSYRNEYNYAVAGKFHIVVDGEFQLSLNGVNVGSSVGHWNASGYTKIPVAFREVQYKLSDVEKWFSYL